MNQQSSKNQETNLAETFEEGLFKQDLASIPLAAIDNSNRLSKTNSGEIYQGIEAPQGVTAINTGPLTCYIASVELIGSSTTADARYKWTGPNGFVATTATAQTTLPGDYTLTVTDPSSGCTAIASTTVGIDQLSPEGVKASITGPITCNDSLINLTGSSTTPDVSYEWTGPDGFTAETQNALTGLPGLYNLKVTNLSNGCSVRVSTLVDANYSVPEGVAANTSGVLDCYNSFVNLIGSSTAEDVSYEWTGPHGFFATTATAQTTLPGEYTLTVTDLSNGCMAQDITTVEIDTSGPKGVKATNTGPITCNNPIVELIGHSTTKEVRYEWYLLPGFPIADRIVQTSFPGNFTLNVTDLSNGCSATTSTIVESDLEAPSGYFDSTAHVLANEINTISYINTSGDSLLYSWSVVGNGWEIISGQNNNPELNFQAGDIGTTAGFSLETTLQRNGCTSSQHIELNAIANKRVQDISKTDLEDGIQLKTYPNPFNQYSYIEFITEKNDFVTVSIYALNGQYEKLVFNAEVKGQEQYQVSIDGTEMAEGTYVCVIRTKDKVYTRKLVLSQL